MRTLFIGNSFTARNNLPDMIAQLARSAGHRLDWKLISAGGASLRRHWNKGVAVQEIQEGNYDRVVLQEQSTLPVKNAKRMHENVRLFDNAIRQSGARTALYMTWARQHAPEAQDVIADAYASIANELDADVIPTGLVWQRVLRLPRHPVLHDRDGSHPTLAGSYLAACCAVAVLFKANPVGLWAPDAVTAADATLLQHAARNVTRVE
jgi:hypothetical protein